MSPARPRFLEFFAGGGLARAGLEHAFECVFANDIDAAKCAAYRVNFSSPDIVQRDVWKLTLADLPLAELAWASFPCQDLSLAGVRRGLNAPRSGAFWGFWGLMERLLEQDRAPATLVLENVPGLLSSRAGRDFFALTDTLAGAGYRVGALMIDAADFLPQSRQRLFVIAHRGRIPEGAIRPEPDPHHHPAVLQEAVARLAPPSSLAWTWWRLPAPPLRNSRLADVIDDAADPATFRSEAARDRLLDQMSPLHRARVDAALSAPGRQIGAVYRRIRVENGRRVQRAEVRYDGLAGCLRTPAGGSSRQLLLVSDGGRLALRAMSPAEAARLMGCPDGYVLPRSATAALKLIGDGVCTPAVRWLCDHLLTRLADCDTARAEAA